MFMKIIISLVILWLALWYAIIAIRIFNELSKEADELKDKLIGEGTSVGPGYDILVIVISVFWPMLFVMGILKKS